ncbi:MAG: hypothetical protein AN488_02335 [Anabaena sp. WA113]|jgi:hypothetical protein|uniref:Uncharacterized protein n=1 Tax=Aphanizomenon flos-aquae WA102 TaxID=1710896 RepID=A0A1B7WWR1_APHFL|nr:MAG: hypothetical protein AN488_02335 [Anabaena sp. WA113]OBQ41512.1 MAG: hypothetical protein AN484_20815 [Aphanizomenon flos-aquae WA102]
MACTSGKGRFNLSSKNDWEQICHEVQERLLITPLEVKSAKTLWAELLKCLIAASDDGFLETEHHKFHNLLKMKEDDENKGMIIITGGKKNQKRRKEVPHFERFDGCWFDFAITVDEKTKPAKVIAFNFEIRFLDDNPIGFLRFDLNPPGHNNEKRGIRFHIHLSSDNVKVHSPPMSPLEILHLFLYDLKMPERPRSS